MIVAMPTRTWQSAIDEVVTTRGWTNEEAAEALGVSGKTISAWRRGAIREPRLEQIQSVIAGLGQWPRLRQIVLDVVIPGGRPAAAGDEWPVRRSQVLEADQPIVDNVLELYEERARRARRRGDAPPPREAP